jgi:hypothetical protein
MTANLNRSFPMSEAILDRRQQHRRLGDQLGAGPGRPQLAHKPEQGAPRAGVADVEGAGEALLRPREILEVG